MPEGGAGRLAQALRARAESLGVDPGAIASPTFVLMQEYPARLKCKDGSIKDVLIDSSVLFRDEEFVHTRCFTRDITERKRAERALRESEERLAAELDAMSRLHALSTRLVAATDRERRRIERDLHDGAQQRLISIGIGMAGATALCRSDPAAAATADREPGTPRPARSPGRLR